MLLLLPRQLSLIIEGRALPSTLFKFFILKNFKNVCFHFHSFFKKKKQFPFYSLNFKYLSYFISLFYILKSLEILLLLNEI